MYCPLRFVIRMYDRWMSVTECTAQYAQNAHSLGVSSRWPLRGLEPSNNTLSNCLLLCNLQKHSTDTLQIYAESVVLPAQQPVQMLHMSRGCEYIISVRWTARHISVVLFKNQIARISTMD